MISKETKKKKKPFDYNAHQKSILISGSEDADKMGQGESTAAVVNQ